MGRGVARHDALASKARFAKAKATTPKPEACALPVAVASRAGITARDAQSHALAVRDTRARNVAYHVWDMAQAFARSFQRRWEAEGGKPFDSLRVNPFDELAGMYRAAFIGAYARCSVCPSGKRALYQRASNQLGFRAMLAWHRAYKSASSQVRSYLWERGAEACHVESLASPYEIRRWALTLGWNNGEDTEAPEAWQGRAATVADAPSLDALGHVGSPLNWRMSPVHARAGAVPVARVRRELRHARWCLRAFWMVNASRKWRAGYVSDSQLLRAVTLAARGYGVAALAPGLLNNGDATQGHGARGARACSDALRQAVKRLKARLRDGDKLLTDKPEACARAFVACVGVRASRLLVADILPSAKRETKLATVPARDAAADFAALHGVAD